MGTPLSERLEQLAIAADALSRAATDREAIAELRDRLGVSRYVARELVRAVKRAWAAQADLLTPDKFDELRGRAIDERRRIIAEVLQLARDPEQRGVVRVRAYEVALRYLDSIALISGYAVHKHQHYHAVGLADAIAELQQEQAKAVDAEVVGVRSLQSEAADASAEGTSGSDG